MAREALSDLCSHGVSLFLFHCGPKTLWSHSERENNSHVVNPKRSVISFRRELDGRGSRRTCTLSRDLRGRGEMACTSLCAVPLMRCLLTHSESPRPSTPPTHPHTYLDTPTYSLPTHPSVWAMSGTVGLNRAARDGGQWDTPVQTQVSSRLRTESPGWGRVYARENTGVKNTNHCNTVITGAAKKGQKRGRNQRLRKVGAGRLWKLSRRLCEQFGEPDQQMMGTEDAIIPGTFHIDDFLRSFNNNNGYHYWGTTISQARLNVI